LFAVFPEAPWDSALALLFPEWVQFLAALSDLQAPVTVAELTAAFVPVRRSFRRTRDMLKPPAGSKYEISN
jgi:hypothetical protein